MAAACAYEGQLASHRRPGRRAGRRAARAMDLVYQSRSGPPQQPWLGPDVNDHIRALDRRPLLR